MTAVCSRKAYHGVLTGVFVMAFMGGTTSAQLITGACCNSNGTCSNGVTAIGCIFSDGIFQGENSLCSNTDCRGACCLGSSCVNDHTSASCNGIPLGRFKGPQTSCSQVACTGACCSQFGECVNSTTSLNCSLFAGNYLGDGSTCDESTCVGACCFLPLMGSCTVTTDNECAFSSGSYQGNGSDCSACDGACCLDDGSCYETTSISCTGFFGAGGSFQGRGTDCDTVTCAPAGACCFDGEACQTLTEAACSEASGEYQGDGTTCQETCSGACCLTDGQCLDRVFSALCDGLQGSYQGDRSTCAESCAGACCLPDDECLSGLTAHTCLTSLGGRYQGNGTECDGGACPFFSCPGDGECCLANGTSGCLNRSCCESVCNIAPTCCIDGWTQFCANIAEDVCGNRCTATGACCQSTGGCADGRTAVGCDQTGGIWIGPGSTCQFSICRYGACCVGGGECIDRFNPISCILRHGQYFGDGSICVDSFCPNCPGLGNCCEANGSISCVNQDCCETVCSKDDYCCDTEWDGICADEAAQLCGSAAGTYCVIQGSCCLPNATCAEGMTQGDCEAARGRFNGAGSQCFLTNCEFGACCGDEGVCLNDVNRLSCLVNFGSFLGHASNCVEASCPECAGDGDCCAANGSPGCSDALCCHRVTNIAPDCGFGDWDETCAELAGWVCGSGDRTYCESCPGQGDCCTGNGTPGCETEACCANVCAVDPACCTTGWDDLCAIKASHLCDNCGCPDVGDVDGDCDVDLHDYSVIQDAFTGPR